MHLFPVQAESNKSNLTPETKPLKQPKRKKQNKQHKQSKIMQTSETTKTKPRALFEHFSGIFPENYYCSTENSYKIQ